VCRVLQGTLIKIAQAGGSHTVALSSDFQVYTFGSGGSGRLGHGESACNLNAALRRARHCNPGMFKLLVSF
jgi:hypothetical protein